MKPKQQSLARSTSLVSFFTFLSRIMGFIRDMVLATLFGAEAGMDAFFVAFRIPNFMRRLFAEGAFSQAFVPVLAEYQQTKSFDDVRTFIARIAGQLTMVLSLVTIIGVLASPLIIWVFAPGFGEGTLRFTLATEMLRITFPYLMLVSLTAMSGALLNTYGYFGVPAITPVFLNLAMILTALYLSPHLSTPVYALAWGVFFAGIIQFLFQLPFLLQRNLLIRPKLVRNDEGVKRVLKLMVPALFGVSIAQLNLMVDSIFASFLKEGSVSWLYFTDRLTDFPLGVFGVAIATVILPQLSRNFTDDKAKYSKSLSWGIQAILVIGIPAAIGLTFFSMPLIATCFAYGAFTSYDLVQTQKSLIALSSGVPAFMLVKVLASGFYAGQNIKTPVKVGALAMLLNSILCALLIGPLAHAGLALASTIAGYMNCSMLMYLLIKRDIYKPMTGWTTFFLKLLVADCFVGFYLYWVQGNMNDWLQLTAFHRLLQLGFKVGLAGLIYFASLYILGFRLSQFRGRTKG